MPSDELAKQFGYRSVSTERDVVSFDDGKLWITVHLAGSRSRKFDTNFYLPMVNKGSNQNPIAAPDFDLNPFKNPKLAQVGLALLSSLFHKAEPRIILTPSRVNDWFVIFVHALHPAMPIDRNRQALYV